MTMQRRHFELIAEAIAAIPHGDRGFNIIVDDEQHAQLAQHFARKLRATNPNFNEARFLRACGVTDA